MNSNPADRTPHPCAGGFAPSSASSLAGSARTETYGLVACALAASIFAAAVVTVVSASGLAFPPVTSFDRVAYQVVPADPEGFAACYVAGVCIGPRDFPS